MSETTRRAPARDMVSIGCAVVWLLGATASRWVGVWPGIAGTGITLGALALLLYGRDLAGTMRPTPTTLAWGALAALLMLVVTYGLYPVSARVLPGLADQTTLLYSRFGTVSGFTLAVLPLAIVSEELVWRGLIQDSLTRRLGPMPGALAAALVYGGSHLPAGTCLAALALTCGVFWGLLRARTQSLLVPLLAHLAWDFAVMVLLPLAPR